MSRKDISKVTTRFPIVENPESEEENSVLGQHDTFDQCSTDCPENLPLKEISDQFILAAEKYMKDMDLVSRKEKHYATEIKEALQQQAKKGISAVKASMKLMHARYAKELDEKMNEMASVLTRIEHLQEEIQEFKQWEDRNNESESSIDNFLQKSLQKKELIESVTEKNIRELNRKRANDERLFLEFAESIHQQVQYSINALEICLERSEKHRKAMMESKFVELRNVLQEIQKMG